MIIKLFMKYIFLLFVLFNFLEAKIQIDRSCKNVDSDIKQRFNHEIKLVRDVLIKNDKENRTLYNSTTIVMVCDGSETLAFSKINKDKNIIALGVAFLDIIDRLSYLVPLEILGAKDIIDKYPIFLAKEILYEQKTFTSIPYPLPFIKDNYRKVVKTYKESDFMKEVRVGSYFSMIAYLLEHEFAHLKLFHLKERTEKELDLTISQKEELFQIQEYEADYVAAELMKKTKVSALIGVILNQYMIHANQYRPTLYFNSHPPTYLRSILLIKHAIHNMDSFTLNMEDRKRYGKIFSRFSYKYMKKAFDQLGWKYLINNSNKKSLNKCINIKYEKCMKSCINKYKNTEKECRNNFCNNKKNQGKYSLVDCHLKQQIQKLKNRGNLSKKSY